MSTIRQKKVAKLIIENATLDKPKTGGEIVESSGYGVSMKKNPQVVIGSDGVQEELEKSGFTVDNAKRVVTEIMLNSKERSDTRLRATEQVFKVNKSYGDAPSNSIVNVIIPNEVAKVFNINGTDTETIRNNSEQEPV